MPIGYRNGEIRRNAKLRNLRDPPELNSKMSFWNNQKLKNMESEVLKH